MRIQRWKTSGRSPRSLALLALLVVAISCFLLLRFYTVGLIHTVVVHGLIQKAPPNYPSQVIEDAFDQARRAASEAHDSETYLKRLFEISQRLEKTQSLTEQEVSQLLAELRSTGGQ